MGSRRTVRHRRRAPSGRAAAGALLLLPALAWVSAGEPAPPRVYTLLDYFESGQRAVREFIGAAGPASVELDAAIGRAKLSCARLEVRRADRGSGFASVIASAVLVDGGRRLLTAGHSFAGGETGTVVVTLPSGETRPARLVDYRYRPGSHEDWAVLDLQGPAAAPAAAAPAGDPRRGDLVFVLGYPDRLGLDAAGRVAHCPGAGGAYREPLTLLAEVDSVEPLRLIPRAGAIPIGGMSGGPVFDARGRLVGIFASVSRIEERGEVSYAYNGSVLPPRAGGPDPR